MHKTWPVIAVAAASVAATGAPALAAPDFLLNRVYLGCAIELEKVLVITNTLAGPVPAGTKISYDAVLKPYQQHQAGALILGPPLQPGRQIKKGLSPAFSCAAWYVRPLLMAPPQ